MAHLAVIGMSIFLVGIHSFMLKICIGSRKVNGVAEVCIPSFRYHVYSDIVAQSVCSYTVILSEPQFSKTLLSLKELASMLTLSAWFYYTQN